MNLLIIGPPGAGKGTQSEMLCEKYNISQLATGDILRFNVKNETELGLQAKSYMASGKLVPDELIINMMKDEILKPVYANGFILDGFPRTIAQADALNILLEEFGKTLDKVIILKVPNEKIIERMSGRRICRSCNRTYHIIYNPPPMDGECSCGNSDIYQRDDDKEETVIKRLEVYDAQTSPLVEYYKSKGKISEINGDNDLNAVFLNIVNSIS
ncbi:MAG: adenylate kinase [Ignavibacteria bacterium GWF2_33_9]|nr:MAG: adenylate kinase [Ignavibacteria bacterium GWF2_33_9]